MPNSKPPPKPKCENTRQYLFAFRFFGSSTGAQTYPNHHIEHVALREMVNKICVDVLISRKVTISVYSKSHLFSIYTPSIVTIQTEKKTHVDNH